MLKNQLDTPSLILDIDLFEKNLAAMRDFAASRGKKLRPHAKTHKCPEIARRQLACGNCADRPDQTDHQGSGGTASGWSGVAKIIIFSNR